MKDKLYINDLKRHIEPLSEKIKETINRVVDSGRYILYKELEEFEAEFSKYCNTKHCVGVNNGTDGLEIALKAFGCSQNDKVITVANAGGYSTTAILSCGAKPVYVDINPTSFNVDTNDLKKKINQDIKAIIVTHLYGRVADIDKVIAVAKGNNIPVIEDCSQAHGAMINGQKVGSFGDAGVFSFFPTKNLGALGDAGCVVTNDDESAGRVRQLRQYGWSKKYYTTLPMGRKSRMDEIQAAILKEFLPYLDGWNQRRVSIAKLYNELLKDLSEIHTPNINEGEYVAHLYVIGHPKRDKLLEWLINHNIMAEIHFPVPDYRQEAVIKTIGRNSKLSNTELVTSEILSLPCFPEMTLQEVEEVCRVIRAFHD